MVKWEGKIRLSEGYDAFFVDHIMDPEFEKSKYDKQINPYYAKFGFKFPMTESEYYKRLSGVESDVYLPQTLFWHYLIPYLNDSGYVPDKNQFRKLLDVYHGSLKVPFTMAHQIVYNVDGLMYDGNGDQISKEEAVVLAKTYEKDMILKPTFHTKWGSGIVKVQAGTLDDNAIMNLFANYKQDYSLEECIEQHPDYSTFNPSSVNTTRLVTYRKPNGSIKVLFALQRFGNSGAVVDNASAGGNIVSVAMDGTVSRTIIKYKTLKTDKLDDRVTAKIPCFDKLVDAVKYMHSKLPNLNYVGWDMSVSPDGIPILIEFNSQPSVCGTQLASGPAFSKEDLDEIMPHIAKWKINSVHYPTVSFSNGRGRMKRINNFG